MANRNFLITSGKVAGDASSTRISGCVPKSGFFFSTGDTKVGEGRRAKSACRDVGQAASAVMGAAHRPKFLEIGRVRSPPASLAPGHRRRNPERCRRQCWQGAGTDRQFRKGATPSFLGINIDRNRYTKRRKNCTASGLC